MKGISAAGKTLIQISTTEKTIIDIRAQFFKCSNPTPDAIPMPAGTKYIRDTKTKRILGRNDGPGSFSIPVADATSIAINTTTPSSRVSADPSKTSMAIAVTPGDRLIICYPSKVTVEVGSNVNGKCSQCQRTFLLLSGGPGLGTTRKVGDPCLAVFETRELRMPVQCVLGRAEADAFSASVIA